MSSLTRAREVLEQVWGFQDFRANQRRAIVAVLAKRDVLALLPTGGGKSLCFQVPALVSVGTTLVISPLISLMQDQVAALRKRNVPAAYLSSTQSEDVQSSVWEFVQRGDCKILYVAPERLKQLVARIDRIPVALLAIDEAHCISEWGHDFRPHYRTLGRYRLLLGRPPTIAVTATATERTQEDIMSVLFFKRPVIVSESFDRPNLVFNAKRFATERRRVRAAAQVLRQGRGSSIVYVPTRNRTDGVTTVLRWWNIRAYPYHAGLPARERRALLKQFMRGTIRVMVATNAFGMGIDKSDVRQVVHLGVPTRPEAYYQEAGRAGRDGQPATCSLFWTPNDFRLAARMAGSRGSAHGGAGPELEEVRRNALDVMRNYVKTKGCRRRILLRFFGETVNQCEACDACIDFNVYV